MTSRTNNFLSNYSNVKNEIKMKNACSKVDSLFYMIDSLNTKKYHSQLHVTFKFAVIQ